MQFKIPVLALSQFNRDASKQGRKPELHDLRESGSIEQDANIAILLSAKKGQEHQAAMEVDVDIAKNRSGRRGQLRMMFMKPFSQFEEIS
jgi:replicative DNA helicase